MNSLTIGGSQRCGKSISHTLTIFKYVRDGKFPSWTLDCHIFLQKWGLTYYISSSKENSNLTEIHILNVKNNELKNLIFKEVYELGLIFIIEEEQIPNKICTDMSSPHWGDILSFKRSNIDFIIREPKEDEDIEKINYTLYRKIF